VPAEPVQSRPDLGLARRTDAPGVVADPDPGLPDSCLVGHAASFGWRHDSSCDGVG
jgi:hypothetical protein